MSDPRDFGKPPLGPRIRVADEPDERRIELAAPFVRTTEETGQIVASVPAERPRTDIAMPRRADRGVRWGMVGIAVFLAGWLGVDAYLWISGAFANGSSVGWIAAVAVAAGVAGGALVIGRELKSFFALKSVEANQKHFMPDAVSRPEDMKDAVRTALAVIPKDRETEAAIEAFQRQAQRHHTPTQQAELLSRTVMTPLDRRAEAIVRRAVGRAFAITAVSPTAITDTVFFIAMAVRMVRGIAAVYGHRPTAAATTHLLRRLVVEAGRLGAVDLAGATLGQHLTGAVAERLATTTAEAAYASQRMARIGLIAMGLCRPVPFRDHEVPGIFSSLIGNLFNRKSGDDTKAIR
jgi:putative membrane protein